MRIKHYLLFLAVFLSFSGCDVSKQVSGAYNMAQCKYDFNSVSGLNISGMDLSKGIQPLQIVQLTSLLTGKPSSVPLNMTLNVDVTNPNSSAALLNGLQYILSIDNVQFTTGSVNEKLNVPAGGKQLLPLVIGVDLAALLKGESKDAVGNIVKNLVGVNDQKSQVTLQLKPSFMIGNQAVSSPVYIPVNFSFGGKK